MVGNGCRGLVTAGSEPVDIEIDAGYVEIGDSGEIKVVLYYIPLADFSKRRMFVMDGARPWF